MGPSVQLTRNQTSGRELPRDKYTETDPGAVRPVYATVVGALIVSTLGVLKNVLFGSSQGADVPPVQATDPATMSDATGRPAPTLPPPTSDAPPEQPPAAAFAEVEQLKLGLGLGRTVIFERSDSFVGNFGRAITHGLVDDSKAAGLGASNVALSLIVDNGSAGTVSGRGGSTDGSGSEASRGAGDDATTGASGEDPADEDAEDDAEVTPSDRINRAPVVAGAASLRDIFINQSMVIGLTQLLQQATDADGDALSVFNLTASSGHLQVGDGGAWVFTPDRDVLGEVSFTYEVSDGALSAEAVSLLMVRQLPGERIVGTDGDDTILGTPGNDVIAALAGDDVVIAREADDVIDAGTGNDRVHGGSGDDVIRAGSGDDVVFAGAGNDVVYGEAGNDSLFGEEGNDLLFGDDGDDQLSGGDGNDQLFGGAGSDVIRGDEGRDVIDGGEGDDQIWAGADNDIIVGSDGRDVLHGDAGDDTFVAVAGDGDDVIEGGEGIDTLDFSALSADVVVDLAGGVAASEATGEDRVAGIEVVYGGLGQDWIGGDGADNILSGGAGDDILLGLGGDDTFIAVAGDGDDIIDGGEGVDTLDYSALLIGVTVDLMDAIAVHGGAGEDQIAGIENVIGGWGNDQLIANDEVNIFTGGDGDDIFVFRTILAAGSGTGSRDRILDFTVGDRIDLDDISRDFAARFEDILQDEGIRRFSLIDSGAAFSQQGELRIRYEDLDNGTVTVIEGNIDSDAETEFEIELYGHLAMTMDDFYMRG